jgi:Raf kinase inhibitor-like YbhB/YbcL family protein
MGSRMVVSTSRDREVSMSLNLVSTAFANGERIPQRYARLGENLLPPLRWNGAPADVQSYALMIEDPDAPSGTFRHCGIFNIPPEWDGLPESTDTASRDGVRFVENDFGNVRYDGPQPPRGHGVHHYYFRLAALDVASLPVTGSAGVEGMWREARKHFLAQASLVGTFEAQ